MTLTVSEVRSWRPESLRSTAAAIHGIVGRVDGQRSSVLEEQDTLAESWSGVAATAAADRIVAECSRISRVAVHMESLAAAYDAAARIVEAARDHVEFEVTAAAASSFDVSDQGAASAEALIALLPTNLAENEVEARALRQAADDQSIRIADALRQAADAAVDAARQLEKSTLELTRLGLENPPGRFVEDAEGGFTWWPDVPTTTASTVISGMTTSVTEGLKNATAGSIDDVAKNIGRGFGAFGAVLGTVPAIKSDNDGGMDPTKAVVTNSAGTLAAVGTAWATGALAGTAVCPGVGTVGGAVIGPALGAFAAWGTTKTMQRGW